MGAVMGGPTAICATTSLVGPARDCGGPLGKEEEVEA